MTDELTQAEGDALLAMAKRRADDVVRRFPGPGEFVSAPLMSEDKKEHFLLDVGRRSLNISRVVFQARTRVTVVLERLDLGGPPHRNPDDEEIGVPHLHVYRAGYGDKWAYPVSIDIFPNLDDRWATLADFMKYCAVVHPPLIEKDLVS